VAVTEPAWVRDLRKVTDVRDEFPPCDEDEPFELLHARFSAASTAEAVFVKRVEIIDVALEHCDIAGFGGTDGRADRVLVEDSRLRGVTWANGIVQDVILSNVTGAEVSFRFSSLRRVVFRDCSLPGLDFTETVFDDVRLERCQLQGAQFDHARVNKLRIEGCDLSGCTGAQALAGASVHPDDVLSLGPSLAVAIGMTIE
jgi:uncharacterized protein YjbI with pentapeptide repeats